MGGGERPFKRTPHPAAAAATVGARSRTESTTLVFAVAVAVTLGVACGVWLNSLLASASSAGRAAPARVPSGASADAPPPAVEPGTLQGSIETADAGAAAGTEPALTEKGPLVTEVEGRAPKPAATPVAREASPRPKVEVRLGTTWEVERRASPEREQGRAKPCALYASASALNIRGGGAAPLVLGGPGEAGPVNVSTPSWADIAVFREGGAAGGRGWVRYLVKSVSKRPGLYAVHFNTPCGSQTVRVTVAR